MKSDAEIAQVARDWGRMRLLVLAVKEARNSCRCEEEYRGCGDPYDPSQPPCWMTHEWKNNENMMNTDGWCDECLERHKWHVALCAIKRINGGRLRKLQRTAVR